MVGAIFVYTVFGFFWVFSLMLSWMFQHDYLDTAVLSVLYACVLYFCICTCSDQLSMCHRERRSRNTLIIIIIIIIITLMLFLVYYTSQQHAKCMSGTHLFRQSAVMTL